MSWTDKGSIKTIKKLRDFFKINTFLETGTFKGVNARVQSENFNEVITCEKEEDYYKEALRKTRMCNNVSIHNVSSPKFLSTYLKYYTKDNREDIIFIYLDAHFYDPNADNKFIVLEELRALQGFKNCVICIHDFDNGLGHIKYDNQSLDWGLIKEDFMKVNPEGFVYTNELKYCDVYDEKTILDSGIEIDAETMDNIHYANSSPEKKYRGIIYLLPKEIKNAGRFGLRRWER